ncbi:MAG: hypothetical protein AAFW67_13530, partial [Cyanobacteria bacterium J06638_38]
MPENEVKTAATETAKPPVATKKVETPKVPSVIPTAFRKVTLEKVVQTKDDCKELDDQDRVMAWIESGGIVKLL